MRGVFTDSKAPDKTLDDVLRENVKEGILYEKLENNAVCCFACGHRCVIKNGRSGICKVRFNESGKLFVPSGYVGAFQIDPIEKKPFFHALPGSLAASFGMLGCDFHCAYCQNWVTSQAVRDPEAVSFIRRMTPADIVKLSKEYGAPVVTSTYNEPLITSEWAVDVLKIAKSEGLRGAYVSNGNGTEEALKFIRPYVDFYKVDLKSFNDRHYRELGGVLENVLRTIEKLVEMKFWVEVVTLTIPGFNDSDDEMREIAKFLAGVSNDIPWHVTAFHQDYKMLENDSTPVKTLLRGAQIGEAEGLRYVYAGNLPGQTATREKNYENTYCPKCKTCLIERWGFKILRNVVKESKCPKCGEKIAGVWN